MKSVLVTPFLGHLPLYPSSYLGYGAAVLRGRVELDVIDLNAEICFKHRRILREIFADLDKKQVVSDNSHLGPLRHDLLKKVNEEYNLIPWRNYESVFITMPSWFLNVETESILQLAAFISRESPKTKMFFFGNSLGSWTDEYRLKKNDVNIVHLNNLFQRSAVKSPVNYDILPTPIYENRERYVFDILPFRLKHGCIWGRCKFCSLSKGWNSGYKERFPGKVIEEIEAISIKYNPKMFACNDNALNGGNLLEFCFHFERFDKPWAGMARADLSSKEIVALRRAGCKLIYFGLESGSDRLLFKMNKGITSNHISDFIKKLFDNNIMPGPSLIVGSPDETECDFDKTIEFILDRKKYFSILNVYPFMLTPGSDFSLMNKDVNRNVMFRLFKLTELCKEIGIKICIGEQNAEYIFYKAAYPDHVSY